MWKRLVLTLVLFALPAAALAQTEGAPPEAYTSPMRDQCAAELSKDARWKAELRNQVRAEVHDQDARQMLNNKKHVVAAYACIWALTVGCVLLLWLRQQRLKQELARLEEELAQAKKGG